MWLLAIKGTNHKLSDTLEQGAQGPMSDSKCTIRLANTTTDYEAFGRVCRSYVDWCRERYRDMPWFVEEVFGYQSLDDELKVLAVKYGQPNGRTMVVTLGDQIVAGGAYRHLSDTVCELKRYMSPTEREVSALVASCRMPSSPWPSRTDTG